MNLKDDEMAEYLKENEDMQTRQWAQKMGKWQRNADKLRFEQIRGLAGSAKTILSVGCGPKEPIGIGATHACDIAMTAERFLRAQEWKGEFKQCSCDKLQYPDKSMDFVVCSEVIEHLPNVEDIRRTFFEVDRVGKNWVVTTPWIDRAHGNTEPTHRHFLNEEKIREIMPEWNFLFVRYDIFLFIMRCRKHE